MPRRPVPSRSSSPASAAGQAALKLAPLRAGVLAIDRSSAEHVHSTVMPLIEALDYEMAESGLLSEVQTPRKAENDLRRALFLFSSLLFPSFDSASGARGGSANRRRLIDPRASCTGVRV